MSQATAAAPTIPAHARAASASATSSRRRGGLATAHSAATSTSAADANLATSHTTRTNHRQPQRPAAATAAAHASCQPAASGARRLSLT